jgi:hypothetical protein
MARLWERRYATSSILMALATGAIGARCFLSSDILVLMFAAGLMCGLSAFASLKAKTVSNE